MADAVTIDFSEQISEKGEMSAGDLLKLRRMIGADFEISYDEADILFRLNENVKTPDDWAPYFITVITSFLTQQTPPQGYISDINASWLRSRIEHDGVVDTQVELALLLNVIRYAHNVTDSLELFALEQVTLAVLNGSGYIGKHRKLTPGIIGQTEVEILRQVLYGVSSPGGIGITRMEAEYLIDLNEATLGREHHPDWQRLFVLAIANHLMMQAAWEEPSAQEALRRQNWLENTDGKQLYWTKSMSNAVENIFGSKSDTLSFHNTDIADINQAEKVTFAEADWLIQRLNRDGGLDVNEQALLDFLSQECPDIHASLMPYLKAA